MAVQQEAIPQSIERPVRRSGGCRAERLRSLCDARRVRERRCGSTALEQHVRHVRRVMPRERVGVMRVAIGRWMVRFGAMTRAARQTLVPLRQSW
jgi:hypothetical protein